MGRITSSQANQRLGQQAQAIPRARQPEPAGRVETQDDSPPLPVAARMRMIVLLALGLWVIIGGIVAAVLLA